MFEYVITRPMGFIIEHIYNFCQNYGLAIILFTIIIKLILMPLNIRSQKAMRKQQKIQPVLQELQKKYANDQQKLQQETMKLYKENNISMMGGCLPLLLQMPILIGLYRVIQSPLSYLLNIQWGDLADAANPVVTEILRLRDGMAELGYNLGNYATAAADAIVKTGQIQLSKWAQVIGINGTALEGVTGNAHPWSINFNFLGLDLSNAPSASINKFMALDFSDLGVVLLILIPVLAVASSLLSMKITQMQSGQTNSAAEGGAASMSKTMTWMMPIMTGFFTFTLPAGLGLYWIISSLVQVVQQLGLNYYFDRKGEDESVIIPEKKIQHGKKRKK